MKWFQQRDEPQDGQARALEQPQPLQGFWEPTATHEVWSEEAGGWVPAVVEQCGGQAFIVPAMRTWPESDE